MPRALILGAGSAIAQAVARQLASEGYDLILGARHAERLLSLAADVELRTKRTVAVAEFDALDAAALESLPERLEKEFGVYCLVVVVFGYLGDQTRATVDSVELLRILNSNFTGAALALTHLANYLEKQDGPCGIIGISSVAGDRGRQSNYAYGSAKGALTLFLQGLRNRLSMSGIHVMTVNCACIPEEGYVPWSATS